MHERRTLRVIFLAAGMIGALSALGCGVTRTKRGLTRAQFIASADAVCLLEQEKLAFIAQRAGKLARVPLAPPVIRQQVAASQRATAKLESLPEPPADTAALARWLTARTVAATVALDLAEAPAHKDAAAVRDVLYELGKARARARGLARAYGFEACRATD